MTPLACRTEDRPVQSDGFRVEVDARESRADIVLDRPPFNPVSMALAEQLRIAFEALDHDPAVRVIVLRGHGEHFSIGCELRNLPREESDERIARRAWTLNAAARCDKPVVAVNRGYCFGVGFELALACDFRIATETTLYALSAHSVMQGFGSGAARRLQKMLGHGRTKDLVMRSRYIHGLRAYDWGIATDFVADSELESFTATVVRELVATSAIVQRAAKHVLNAAERT
jgi:2-oxoglutaroyl-CoA hydrolase